MPKKVSKSKSKKTTKVAAPATPAPVQEAAPAAPAAPSLGDQFYCSSCSAYLSPFSAHRCNYSGSCSFQAH